jgi:hypothetical protein
LPDDSASNDSAAADSVSDEPRIAACDVVPVPAPLVIPSIDVIDWAIVFFLVLSPIIPLVCFRTIDPLNRYNVFETDWWEGYALFGYPILIGAIGYGHWLYKQRTRTFRPLHTDIFDIFGRSRVHGTYRTANIEVLFWLAMLTLVLYNFLGPWYFVVMMNFWDFVLKRYKRNPMHNTNFLWILVWSSQAFGTKWQCVVLWRQFHGVKRYFYVGLVFFLCLWRQIGRVLLEGLLIFLGPMLNFHAHNY